MAILKTIAVGVVLHGLFTVTIPWLVLRQTTMWPSLPLGPVRWVGVALIAFGAYLYVWCVAYLLKHQTSAVPGQQPQHLQMSGWYGRVRHPLLLGVVAILLGEAIFFSSIALLGYALVYWLWLHLFVTLREERELREAFGDAYTTYAREVPRWLPRLRSRACRTSELR
jgi:protein-S-isoprenylcysteine O-methyltransferase Ste14